MGSIDLQIPRLEDYDICPQLGFISSDVCVLSRLNPYFKAWDDTISQLSSLLAAKRLRQTVRELPVLRVDRLESDAERRHAYVVLGSLVQAYVYEDPKQPDLVVPANISEPFLQICECWGLAPILSYVGYCLWNLKLKNAANINEEEMVTEACRTKGDILRGLDNVEQFASFTSTQDEKAFSLIPTLVEAEGGCLVVQLLSALRDANTGDVSSVTVYLESCSERLATMSRYLQVLHERCAPQVFYNEVRPLIAGSRGLKSEGRPDGFIFELSDGTHVASECVGASAGQGSLFQFLDHMFGIEHKSEILREMRLYMPRKHREFLQVVEKLSNLRQFVTLHLECATLVASFDRCIKELQTWRTKHIGVVTRYVMMPAMKEAGQSDVKGTGGSLPIPFLKVVRDETRSITSIV